jgi:putative SOS response-associated peptidase YedK
MCGRFTQPAASKETLADLFQLSDPPGLLPLFNIAPTQPVAAVRLNLERGQRELVTLRWGLIPSWADDPKIGYKMINARAETAATKPSFRAAFKSRRCLIAADGYYEWQKLDGKKQPYYIYMKGGKLFAFAGLWERWSPPDGEAVESCTILTTDANEFTKPIHNRMPVIVDPADFGHWLDPAEKPDALQILLRPFPPERMDAYPVSTFVNNVRSKGPQCIEPLHANKHPRRD